MVRWLALAVGLCACTDRVGQTSSPSPRDAGAVVADAQAPDVDSVARASLVRVATYNVHLFFDTTCDSGACEGSFERTPTPSAFAARAARLAATLERIDADVIALEEIENQICFDAILAALAARGVDYPVAVFGEIGTPASVDVAVLGRGQLLSTERHRDTTPLPLPSGETTTFARELLEVRIGLRGLTLDFFAAHFRSKNNDDPARRLAEARAAGQILDAAARARPNELVLLGGDLNDVPGSEALTALEAPGTLFRLAADRPLEEQGTYRYQGTTQAIDHLYGAGATQRHYVAGSAVALHDAGGGFGDSDHGVLRADLAVGAP